MVKPSWGTKRTCLSCAARFYDLGRTPIVCPKCSAQFEPEVFTKSRRGRAAAAKAKAAKPVVPVKVKVRDEVIPEAAAAEDEEGTEELIEDSDELVEDEAVVEVVEDAEREER